MKLNNLTVFRDASADALHFLFQDAEVRRCDALVLLNDNVACTEQTQALTKRNVHVQRYRTARVFGFFMYALQIIRSEGVIPHWRRWIAGVPRAGPVVSGQEFVADAQFFAHLL